MQSAMKFAVFFIFMSSHLIKFAHAFMQLAFLPETFNDRKLLIAISHVHHIQILSFCHILQPYSLHLHAFHTTLEVHTILCSFLVHYEDMHVFQYLSNIPPHISKVWAILVHFLSP